MSHTFPISRMPFTAFADNPHPSVHKKLKGRDGYRIRVADYRIIYDIFDDVLMVDVIDLGHRGNIP
jgi:mRNA interferase RelE/StbE